MKTKILAVRSGTAIGLLALVTASQANLIVNGDFETGNTGFTSDYTYVSPGGGSLVPQGVYTVDTNPSNSHGAFADMGDHTSGTGMMMILNGMAGDTKVWEQVVGGLVVSATYTFSFYASSVNPGSPATLSWEVDDASLGSQSLSATTNQWDHFTVNFVATAASHTLSIVDLNGAAGGNDFAIDDVSLVVPEPASMAALGLGALAMLRRRRVQK